MITRAHVRLLSYLAALICFAAAVAAQEPRLTEPDVAALADAKAREAGYPLEAYSRGAPTHVQTSGAWEVHYFARQKQDDRTGAFTVTVDDATGFVALSLSYPTVAASPSRPVVSPFSPSSLIRAVLIGLVVGVVLKLAAWLCRRASHARSDAKA